MSYYVFTCIYISRINCLLLLYCCAVFIACSNQEFELENTKLINSKLLLFLIPLCLNRTLPHFNGFQSVCKSSSPTQSIVTYTRHESPAYLTSFLHAYVSTLIFFHPSFADPQKLATERLGFESYTYFVHML